MRKVYLNIPCATGASNHNILCIPETKWESFKCKLASWLVGSWVDYLPSENRGAFIIQAPNKTEADRAKCKTLETLVGQGGYTFNLNNFTYMERRVIEAIHTKGFWSKKTFYPISLIQQSIIKPTASEGGNPLFVFTDTFLAYSTLVEALLDDFSKDIGITQPTGIKKVRQKRGKK
jgi:hypothetical protein